MIGAVDVEHARLTGLPGTVDDLLEYVAGVELPYHFAGARMDQVVRLPSLQREHERVRHGDGDVEIRDLREVILAVDEVEDVGVIDAQDTHIGAAARATLLHHVGRCIVQLHERHRSRSDPHRRADDVVLGPEAREGEARPTPRLMHERHRPQGVVDPGPSVGERVLDRQHKASGELAQRPARVHQGRRIRHPHPRRHKLIERLGDALDRLLRRSVRPVGSRDRPGDPPEQVLGLLDGLPVLVLDQIAALEDRERVGVQVEARAVFRCGHAQLTANREEFRKLTERGGPR